jgi:hypothetical protein
LGAREVMSFAAEILFAVLNAGQHVAHAKHVEDEESLTCWW